MSKKNEKVGTFDQKIDDVLFKAQPLSKDDIKKSLERDLKMIHVTVAEMVMNPSVLDALAEVYYQRYLQLREKKLTPSDAELVAMEGGDNV